MKKSMAIIAFETYADVLGDDALSWDDLTKDERAAWRAVASKLESILTDDEEESDYESEPGSLFDSTDDEDEDDDA